VAVARKSLARERERERERESGREREREFYLDFLPAHTRRDTNHSKTEDREVPVAMSVIHTTSTAKQMKDDVTSSTLVARAVDPMRLVTSSQQAPNPPMIRVSNTTLPQSRCFMYMHVTWMLAHPKSYAM